MNKQETEAILSKFKGSTYRVLEQATRFYGNLAVTRGDVIGGWSLEPAQLHTGITRLLYPFFAGLLLSRLAKPTTVKRAFLWCSLLLILAFSLPRFGGHEHLWMNGIYDAVCILFVFPFVVYLGASGATPGAGVQKTARFLSNLSYPLYIVHYPFIYLFMAWPDRNKAFLDSASHEAQRAVVLACAAVIFLQSSAAPSR